MLVINDRFASNGQTVCRIPVEFTPHAFLLEWTEVCSLSAVSHPPVDPVQVVPSALSQRVYRPLEVLFCWPLRRFGDLILICGLNSFGVRLRSLSFTNCRWG